MHFSTQKKMHDMQRRYRSPFNDHSEFVVKIPLCYVCASLTQPCWSFFLTKWRAVKKSLFPIFSLRKKNNKMMASTLGSMPNKYFECEAWMWATNPKTKSFMHLASICCPLTFCRNENKNTRSSVHNSNFNTTLLGPMGRQMHKESSWTNAKFSFMQIKLHSCIFVHCLARFSM